MTKCAIVDQLDQSVIDGIIATDVLADAITSYGYVVAFQVFGHPNAEPRTVAAVISDIWNCLV